MIGRPVLLFCIVWVLVSSSPTGHRTGDVTNFLSIPAGSFVYLAETELCQDMENRSYELYYGIAKIGSFDLGIWESRLQFRNRVTFIPKNCMFIVHNMKVEDTGLYRIITMTVENDKLKSHEIKFHINVIDTVSRPTPTEVPTTQELVRNRTANVPGFFSACLSMVPTGNAFCFLLHQFLYWLANKKRHGRRVLSCSRAVDFIQSDRFQRAVKKSFAVNGILSLVCQIVSVVSSFIPVYEYNPLFLTIAIVCLVILAVEYTQLVCLTFKGLECKRLRILRGCLFYVARLLEVAFTACIVSHYCLTYSVIDRQKTGYLLATFVTFLVTHFFLCLLAYLCSSPPTTNKGTTEQSNMMEQHPPNDHSPHNGETSRE